MATDSTHPRTVSSHQGRNQHFTAQRQFLSQRRAITPVNPTPSQNWPPPPISSYRHRTEVSQTDTMVLSTVIYCSVLLPLLLFFMLLYFTNAAASPAKMSICLYNDDKESARCHQQGAQANHEKKGGHVWCELLGLSRCCLLAPPPHLQPGVSIRPYLRVCFFVLILRSTPTNASDPLRPVPGASDRPGNKPEARVQHFHPGCSHTRLSRSKVKVAPAPSCWS